MANVTVFKFESADWWRDRAVWHADIVTALQDGFFGASDFPGMTRDEAIAVERRNVEFCLSQSSIAIGS